MAVAVIEALLLSLAGGGIIVIFREFDLAPFYYGCQ
jgi:hypothetical protein